jgi:hypothetical protein
VGQVPPLTGVLCLALLPLAGSHPGDLRSYCEDLFVRIALGQTLYPLHLRKERSYEFVYLLFHFSSSLTFLIICNGGSWVGSVDQVANKDSPAAICVDR